MTLRCSLVANQMNFNNRKKFFEIWILSTFNADDQLTIHWRSTAEKQKGCRTKVAKAGEERKRLTYVNRRNENYASDQGWINSVKSTLCVIPNWFSSWFSLVRTSDKILLVSDVSTISLATAASLAIQSTVWSSTRLDSVQLHAANQPDKSAERVRRLKFNHCLAHFPLKVCVFTSDSLFGQEDTLSLSLSVYVRALVSLAVRITAIPPALARESISSQVYVPLMFVHF